MGYAKVPEHRRPLGPRPSGSTSLSYMPFICNAILCLVLLLLPFFASAEPLFDTSNALDGPLNLDIASINTTWEAGGYADIAIRVLLSSDMLPSQATEHLLEPDNIELLLIPYRSRTSISLSTDLDLTLVSQEHVGDIGIARYRWLVPTCIRPGRHELQLRTRTSARFQLHTVPVFVVVSDDRRMPCDGSLQVLLNASRRRHPGHVHNHTSPQQAPVTDATNAALLAAKVTTDGIPDIMSPEINIYTEDIRKRDDGYDHGDDSDYDEAYGDPGDPPLFTASVPPYNGSSYTYSASYTYTASENYTTTATSPIPSGTSTAARNGTSSASSASASSASRNGTSTVVVTSTATATSVKTVTSVSTDIETMVTTVTGRDTTEVYTTTQTLISTLMVVVPTIGTGGLLPVNGATGAAMSPMILTATVCVATVIGLLLSMDCGTV